MTTWDLWRHRMKILSTPDNASRIAHIALVDQKLQERYDQFDNTPQRGMNRWFSQPIDQLLGEPLDSKEQWIQIVGAAFHYFD
jgi:predicted aminopeptidase